LEGGGCEPMKKPRQPGNGRHWLMRPCPGATRDLQKAPATPGASGKSQQALGTGVMGGMIAVVVLALLMVPVFFVTVQKLFASRKREESVSTIANPVETADMPQPR
jgi:hypothetical protein